MVNTKEIESNLGNLMSRDSLSKELLLEHLENLKNIENQADKATTHGGLDSILSESLASNQPFWLRFSRFNEAILETSRIVLK
ncbi:hypothetical protein CCZ01_05725 [Helicobacter monodelphidis]|uniref:hypothetical protein n=1 Tax=Helicobacter sp. 15-1451 TaxID=2004995 RepID=UPI000DCE00C1|nr:hypothetical protein [Helicobacter sp. 15-1451]RAX57481.1 hypothetical protein CCZ01_05725 [Helicobacter sp. 15-1451]